jgi:hypothetical protein
MSMGYVDARAVPAEYCNTCIATLRGSKVFVCRRPTYPLPTQCATVSNPSHDVVFGDRKPVNVDRVELANSIEIATHARKQHRGYAKYAL